MRRFWQPPLRHAARLAAAMALAATALAVAAPAQAANSREATEAVRKHRAEQAQGGAPAKPQTAPATPGKSTKDQPYRSSADPRANPNASLKSCLDHVGMNPVARDRCMRQHCTGRWGQGDCPASGGNVIGNQGGNSRTPLGRCLAEAGNNPFRRNACGWRHCKMDWSTPECKALAPQHTQPSN